MFWASEVEKQDERTIQILIKQFAIDFTYEFILAEISFVRNDQIFMFKIVFHANTSTNFKYHCAYLYIYFPY